MTLETIHNAVKEVFEVQSLKMENKNAYYLIAKGFNFKLKDIGKEVGIKHSTVCTQAKTAKYHANNDEKYAFKIEQVRKLLRKEPLSDFEKLKIQAEKEGKKYFNSRKEKPTKRRLEIFEAGYLTGRSHNNK